MKESFADRLKKFNRQPTADTLCLQNVRLGDKYLIFDMIAVGSHSIIYYGIEQATRLQRVFKCYNLKEIQNTTSFQEKQLCKRLSNYEYTQMKKCDSIHMLQLFDIYEDKDCKIVVSEYCNMGSLRSEIDRREGKGTDELRAIAILKQIVTALRNVHRNCNFLHKNLKSKNILIQDGIYKLIDLGLPLKIGSNSSLHKQDGDFLIPEIIMKKAYDQKAEVWNVGVLFHEILFGHMPQALTYNSRNYLISSAVSTILSKDMEPYHRMTKQFLEDCLRTNPDERMTWAQLEDHMIFELIAPRIPRRIEEKDEKEYDSRLSVVIQISEDNDGPRYARESETQAFYNNKFNLEVQLKLMDKQLQQPYQKLGQYMDIQQLDPVCWLPLRKNINKDQHKQYQQLKNYYLQCLKVDFVYYDIFFILKTHPKFKEERDLVQFMYLLISRCFTEMSQLNVIIKKDTFQSKSQSVLISCIKKQTEYLYNDVKKDWQQFSDCLFELQNKWVNIIKDKMSSVINAVEYKKKDAILSGIQGTDYERSDQIDLTVRLYGQDIRQQISKLMTERPNPVKEGLILKYMEKYQQMWNMAVLPDNCLNVKQYLHLLCKIQSEGDL